MSYLFPLSHTVPPSICQLSFKKLYFLRHSPSPLLALPDFHLSTWIYLAKMANTSPGKAILSLLVKTKIPKSIGQPLLLVQNCEFYKKWLLWPVYCTFPRRTAGTERSHWRKLNIFQLVCEREDLFFYWWKYMYCNSKGDWGITNSTESNWERILLKETRKGLHREKIFKTNMITWLEVEMKKKYKCDIREMRHPPFHTSPEISSFWGKDTIFSLVLNLAILYIWEKPGHSF